MQELTKTDYSNVSGGVINTAILAYRLYKLYQEQK